MFSSCKPVARLSFFTITGPECPRRAQTNRSVLSCANLPKVIILSGRACGTCEDVGCRARGGGGSGGGGGGGGMVGSGGGCGSFSGDFA